MEKQKPIEEIQAGWNDFERPKNGSMFQHYKGGRYEIVATGFIEESVAPCVVYKSLESNTVWVRTAEDFFENVEYKGEIVLRFRLFEE